MSYAGDIARGRIEVREKEIARLGKVPFAKYDEEGITGHESWDLSQEIKVLTNQAETYEFADNLRNQAYAVDIANSNSRSAWDYFNRNMKKKVQTTRYTP